MFIYISTSLCNYALLSADVPRCKRNKEFKPVLTVLAKMKISGPSVLIAVLLFCEVMQQASANRSRARWNYRRMMRYQAGRIRSTECKDKEESQETCAKIIKELGYQVCETEIRQLRAKLQRSCAKSCNFCGPLKKSCRYSQFQCCWDGATPRGNIYGTKGCPECKDHMPFLCERFESRCPRNDFLRLHCPKTCKKCVEKRSMPIKGPRINIRDWHKL